MLGIHGRHGLGLAVAPVHRGIHRTRQRKDKRVLHAALRHIDLDDERRRIEIRLLVDQQRLDDDTRTDEFDLRLPLLHRLVGLRREGQRLLTQGAGLYAGEPLLGIVGNHHLVVQIGFQLEADRSADRRSLLRLRRDVHHARHEGQRLHDRLRLAVAQQHDHAARRTLGRSRHDDLAALRAVHHHFGLPVALGDRLDDALVVGTRQHEGDFRRRSGHNQFGQRFEGDAELFVHLQRQHRLAVGQRQIDPTAVLARGDIREERVAGGTRCRAALLPRRLLVIGDVPRVVLDLENGRHAVVARDGHLLPALSDELAVKRPVVLPVGIEFHADSGSRARFAVLDDDLRRFAVRRHERKRVPPPFGIFGHRRDEELAVDERLQVPDVDVERVYGLFECVDPTFQIVEPILHLRIVILATGECQTQHRRQSKHFFHANKLINELT